MPGEEQCQKFGRNRPKRSICSRAVSENTMKQPLPGILVSHKCDLQGAMEERLLSTHQEERRMPSTGFTYRDVQWIRPPFATS
jgi:hypothetical protein